MKKISFLIIVFLISITICGQTSENSVRNIEKPNLVFSGKVTAIENQVKYWDNVPDEDLVFIKLDVSLKNNGSVPVMFLQISDGASGSVWEMTEKQEIGNILYEPSLATSSIAMKESEWEKFKNHLDKPSPPANRLFILQPGKIYNFKTETLIRLDRNPEKDSYSRNKSSLKYLQQLSPVWLRIKFGTWDETPVMISKSKILTSTEKLRFLTQLQKRWSNYGYLWLDEIESEPISLDLRSGIVETNYNHE